MLGLRAWLRDLPRRIGSGRGPRLMSALRQLIDANSIVTKAMPAFTLAGGVPARALDYFGPPGQRPPELAERRAVQT